MNTIELFDPTAAADGWHDVRAPGGYEWWYFDAESLDGQTQLVAIFFDGFMFHPGYLRQWGRYVCNPMRVAPPLPNEFPCVYFALYENGKVSAQFMTQYRDFAGSRTETKVKIGPNLLQSRDGKLSLSLHGTPWKLSVRGPKLLEADSLTADLSFSPRLASSMRRDFLSPLSAPGKHQWLIANPLCDVQGKVTLGSRAVEFIGRGYHDHNYGTAPLGPGIRRWMWGRMLLDDSAVTFHFVEPRDRFAREPIHLIHADAHSTREIEIAAARVEGWRFTAMALRYPKRVAFDNRLRLSNPCVVDTSPFYLRLMYDAQFDDRAGRAFCEIAVPNRLRWPILGRMIEMSIDKRD